MSAVQDQRDFWNEFYDQNKDLKEFDPYVRFIFERERGKLTASKVTVGEAINKIAESAKAELLKMRGGAQLGGKSKEIAESGSDGNSTRRKSSKEGSDSERLPEDVTTASILGARKEARKQALKPGRKK